jgi:hypothetical protein
MTQLQSDDVVVLRVDGKNIYSTVLDTNDISTQRGASYELLDTALKVGAAIEAMHNPDVKVVSLGASSAVIEVRKSALTSLVPAIEAILAKPEKAQFTHDISIVAKHGISDSAFSIAEKGAIAASRWHQLQRVTVGVPKVQTGISDVCMFDRVRPGTTPIGKGEDRYLVSDFVASRQRQGKELRQSTYKRILETGGLSEFKPNASDGFTNDLHELSEYKGKQAEDIDFRMNNKIAVIYADGNGFGGFAVKASEHNVLSAWDKYIRKLRAKLLKHLLQHADATPLMLTKVAGGKGALRLETLEWGGDEMMWVVPAAFGFDFTQKILDFTRDWNTAGCEEYKHAVHKGADNGDPLQHAIGMVFCHRNAPIVRIRQLARTLSDKGKVVGKSASPPSNTVTWAALESFDHLGVAFESGIAKRYNKTLSAADWSLNPNQFENLIAFFDAHKAALPRAQITAAAMRCVHPDMPDAAKVLAHAYRECFQDAVVAADWLNISGRAARKEAAIKPVDLSHEERRAWIWLAETFDYMGSKLA